MSTILTLTIAQLRMYARDRQSLFLSLFFPLMLMFAFGFMNFEGDGTTNIGVVLTANADTTILETLEQDELFNVTTGTDAEMRLALEEGDVPLILLLPAQLPDTDETQAIDVLFNVSDAQKAFGAYQAITLVENALTGLERKLRGTQPMFSVNPQEIRARHFSYINFVVPGLLAFVLMQLAITGSGFNIVEYKRKGILKRLFVTPLQPLHFIISLISMRLLTILVQLGLLLGIAMLAFGATLLGNVFVFIGFIIFGSIMFLSIGFALGGISKTQNAIILFGNLVIFPQMFLSGVFFPLEAAPDWLATSAGLLPLSFVSHALRELANEGTPLVELWPDITGIAVWTAIGLFLAIRYFRWSDAARV